VLRPNLHYNLIDVVVIGVAIKLVGRARTDRPVEPDVAVVKYPYVAIEYESIVTAIIKLSLFYGYQILLFELIRQCYFSYRMLLYHLELKNYHLTLML
jgi:hypothetical protein